MDKQINIQITVESPAQMVYIGCNYLLIEEVVVRILGMD